MTMEDWWNGVKQKIDEAYKEDVSGGLSEFEGAKAVKIQYKSTGAADSSGNYPADHVFEITPKAEQFSAQAEFNEMILEKLNSHEAENEDFWKSMANQYSTFDFEYKPAGVEHSKGRSVDFDDGDTGVVNEVALNRRQLRTLIEGIILENKK